MTDDAFDSLVGDLEERLRSVAELASTEGRKAAASNLAAKLRRLVAQVPEAPADPESVQAVNQAVKMIQAVFPSWTIRSKTEERMGE